MKVNWLVEDYSGDSAVQKLKDEIVAQGHNLEMCKYVPFEGGEYNQFDRYDCVIVMGSLNLSKQLQREKAWYPGVWLDLEADKCSKYYPAFGQHLFNSDYAMVPLKELERNMSFYFDIFGIDGCIFIRPDRGDKTFTGKMWTSEKINNDVFHCTVAQVDPSELVIVSYPQQVLNEWRFVIADGKVITGSLYHTEGIHRREECPLDTPQAEFAQKMADIQYDQTPMYIIDVAENTNHEMKLMEIGSFCCCGLYECDMKPIVEHASKVAWREHQDIMQYHSE
jgi:hypothetical protein